MSKLCPVCEKEGTVRKIKKEGCFPWKGHNFLIKYDCWECQNCTEQYIDDSLDDPFSKAKAEYEELYGEDKDG